nr:fibronectin type III domain-containing protein [Chitinophagales bacterium]
MKFIALPALLLLLMSIQPVYSQCSLPAPTNLQSTMTAESALLKWKLSQSVSYYKVRYRKTGDAIWISSPQLNVSNYTISDLQPGTSYDL